MQYLSDCLAVHEAIETAAEAAAARAQHGADAEVLNGAAGAAALNTQSDLSAVLRALSLLGRSSGLGRSAAIRSDIAALAATRAAAAAVAATAQAEVQQRQAHQQAGGASPAAAGGGVASTNISAQAQAAPAEPPPAAPAPGQMAVAHAQHINRLSAQLHATAMEPSERLEAGVLACPL